MNQWWVRLAIAVGGLILMPILINTASSLTGQVSTAIGQGFQSLTSAGSMSGSDRVEAATKLGLWLVGIIVLIRFVMGARGRGGRQN